jgi:hypothetical protein
MSKQLIDTVLKIDNTYRYEGVEGDLYTHNDLQIGIVPEFEYPTLVDSINFSNNQFKFNFDTFKQNFIKKYNLLRFMFDSNLNQNVLLAGGCISNAIYGKFDDNSDIDIFIYGLSSDEATQKVITILNTIVETEQNDINKKYDADMSKHTHDPKKNSMPYKKDIDYYVMRNNQTISLVLYEKLKIQFILRLYKTPSEILHGFDIGSSAVGFDGKQLLFTTLSKFAYEYHANIVDTTRRSTTYERRLRKYFERGFSIILPNLNIDMLRHPNLEYNLETICKMSKFVFSYSHIAGKHIVAKNIYINHQSPTSDYDDVKELNQYNIFYRNLSMINIVKRETDNFISYAYNNVDINSCIYLPITGVHNIYKTIKDEMLYRKIEVGRLAKYIPIIPIAKLANLIVNSRWTDKDLSEDERCNTIEGIVNQQIQYIESELASIKQRGNEIKWQTTNPGTQLTSSFNPIIEDPSKWYGKYYVNT